MVAGWRTVRRTARAVVGVGVQALFFALATTAGVALITNAAHHAYFTHNGNPIGVIVFRSYELRPDEYGPMLGVLLGALVLVGLISGAWIRSALAHLRPLPTWFVWAALPIVIAVAPAIAFRLGPDPAPTVKTWGSPVAWQRLTHTLTAAAVFAAAVPLGFPLGRSLRSTWRANWKSRRSKYRRARRRLREDR
jgi:hypothetical protein